MGGRVIAPGEASVSVFDHGFTVGDGVFETLEVVRGEPFAARRHLERLRRSADGLGLVIPLSDDDLRAAMSAVLATTPGANRVRVTVTGGMAPPGSARGDAAATVVVAAATGGPWGPSEDVVIVPWPRNERAATAGLKTTSYAENVIALAWAKERGASEAIFLNTAGRLCEGTGSNVFVGIGGELLTPPLGSGCLAGVTRALLLEVAGAREADLSADDLRHADEAFLASTTRGAQPIRAVDGVALPHCPGELTLAARKAFAALVAHDVDP